MLAVRRSNERGYEDKGWLQTYHTFSFDTYHDPKFLNYRSLRVINEDTVTGGKGFGMHPHKDMEILTYVLEGVLEHRDSMGNTGVTQAGNVQLISAGTGIHHSEYNLSPHFPVHFLQIWVLPEKGALEPSYQQKVFPSASKWGQWCLVASRNGRNGSLRIHQDLDLYTTLLDAGDEIVYDALGDRYYWIQIVSGKFEIEGILLEQGDGASIEEIMTLPILCVSSGELLIFDMA